MSLTCNQIKNIPLDSITPLYESEFQDAGLEIIVARYSTFEDDPLFPYSDIEVNCSYSEELTILKAPSALTIVAVYPDLRLVKLELSWQHKHYVFGCFDRSFIE